MCDRDDCFLCNPDKTDWLAPPQPVAQAEGAKLRRQVRQLESALSEAEGEVAYLERRLDNLSRRA